MARTTRFAAIGALLILALPAIACAQDGAPKPAEELAPTTPPVEDLPAPDRAPPRLNDVTDGVDMFGGGRGGLGGLGGVGGPNGPAVLALTDRASWIPNQRVTSQGTEFGMVKESLGLSVPLYRDGPNTVGATAGVGATIFTGNAIVPETGLPFPDTVWNIHFGMNYSHLFANNWFATLGASIGSSSDKPFENWSQVNLGIHAMLRIPSGERNAWLISLAYSPLGQLSFPVPGLAFLWWPDDWLRMNIGLPFQVTITPDRDWQFTASYMLLTNIHTQLSYRVAPKVRIYAGYDWGSEGFHLAEDTNPRERFQYYEMKVNVGTKVVWGQFRFDVSGGYAFDRFFAQGNGAFGSHNQVAIAPGPYVALSGSYRW